MIEALSRLPGVFFFLLQGCFQPFSQQFADPFVELLPGPVAGLGLKCEAGALGVGPQPDQLVFAGKGLPEKKVAKATKAVSGERMTSAINLRSYS